MAVRPFGVGERNRIVTSRTGRHPACVLPNRFPGPELVAIDPD
jgi:hypothetical protein